MEIMMNPKTGAKQSMVAAASVLVAFPFLKVTQSGLMKAQNGDMGHVKTTIMPPPMRERPERKIILNAFVLLLMSRRKYMVYERR